jgi:alginate O-acetyltransferase complex protein AlgI
MTLGSWMRNYLYIPLGGNKVGKTRLYFNLWIVFLASGLWHGASWSFIFWGAFHGLFLVMERAFLGNLLVKAGKIPSIIFTFLIVNLAWVFFRVEKIGDAFQFIKRMFVFQFNSSFNYDFEFKFYLALAFLFSFFAISKFTQKIQDSIYVNTYSNSKHLIVFSTVIVLFILSLSSITSLGFNPFIYFRF